TGRSAHPGRPRHRPAAGLRGTAHRSPNPSEPRARGGPGGLAAPPHGGPRHDPPGLAGPASGTGGTVGMSAARGGSSEPVGEVSEPVGMVLGTEDATPLSFWVAISPGAYLQLDDAVIVDTEVPGRGSLRIAGIVQDVRARHEGASF